MATKSQNTTATKSSGTMEANRKRKLLKLLKQQPNNEQIKDALTNIRYRRKTPKNREWSHSNIRLAKLFKLFTGRADKELFSSNPKVQSAALQRHSTKDFSKLPEGKVSFSIGARAHDSQGNLVWA